MNNRVVANINVSDIVYDESFKISKRNYPEQLRISLELSGMLELPYLLKRDSEYYIFTCHNRIKILQELGVKKISSIILEDPDSEIFMNHLSLKMYRNELGPFGRIKAIRLLKSVFKVNESDLKEFGLKILKLQYEILENDSLMENMAALPEALLNYIDDRDISFKIIKDILILPQSWLEIINTWLKDIQVRVNIFRVMIDNLFDIYRQGLNISVIDSIEYSDDKTLNDSIFRLRYPEFSRLKSKSDAIINELSCKGLSIDFPEYFEKSSVTLKLEINKKNDLNNEFKKILAMDIEKLKELISLL
ncbi:MAG: hypothetical protein FWH53_08525 [Leptospirales bacterium]|nr:hypothetical protein [Leptospirales bacterium]